MGAQVSGEEEREWRGKKMVAAKSTTATMFGQARWIIMAVLIFMVAVIVLSSGSIFLIMLLGIAQNELTGLEITVHRTVQASFFSEPSNSPLIAILGVISTLLGVAVTFYFSRLSTSIRRREMTIRTVLDRRMSPEYQSLLEQRAYLFKPFTEIEPSEWQNAYDLEASHEGTDVSPEEIAKRKKSADAVLTLLNHYEFMALLVRENVLDEKLLRMTIRSIFCTFASDARFLLRHFQKTNPAAYTNLIHLYNSWRRDGATDMNGNPTERPIPA